MSIVEIENMTAAELKAKRAEAEKAVADDPQLAHRYVQARLDASMRDEKLAEQGRTITALQDAHAAAKKIADETQTQLNTSVENALGLADKLAGASGRIASAEKGYAAAATLAKDRRKVLADITALIAPLLAAE